MSDQAQWAVVLGGSVGTGAAIGRSLARDPGLNLFCAHRGHHPVDAEALRGDVESLGRRVAMHLGDAGTAEGAALGAAALLEQAGPRSVKVFVHSIANASLGRLVSGTGPWLTPRHVEKTFASMAHSFVYWAQELVRRDLLAPDARLVGLTNMLDHAPLARCGLVAAAKGALEMYVRELALELGPAGHRVNLVRFSTVITPALVQVAGAEHVELTRQLFGDLVPAGRIGTVEEVGELVSFLASPRAAWFNGATIDFTGGAALKSHDVMIEYLKGLRREHKP